MSFSVTLITVGIMLLYAVPGYLMVKMKAIKKDSISAFAKVLLYICQPCLTIYSFQKVEYTPKLLGELLLFFVITFVLLAFLLGVCWLAIAKHRNVTRNRICAVAVSFGNYQFFGVPLVEALMPDYPDVVLFTTAFFLSMSLLCWTLASYMITQDKKYVSLKNVFINPAMISFMIAMPLFLLKIRLPGQLSDMFTLLGRMSTPLCMLMMGMRLGTVPLKPLFTDKVQYLTVALKLLAMPLFVWAVTALIPMNAQMRQALCILVCCPVANVVLSFSEILGEGQETAANLVLLSTLLSIITIPVMTLII